MNAQAIPHRLFVRFLLALCWMVAATLGLTFFKARDHFPAWFGPVFLADIAVFLFIITAYFLQTLRPTAAAENRRRGRAGLIWALLVGSVICTSALHQFYPFRLDVATVWQSAPTILRFNFILTVGSLCITIAAAVVYFRAHHRLAVSSLLILSAIMLLPNDACGNEFNLPWIGWIGASPLMFLPNSVVLLIGYCALHGVWPRASLLAMSLINATVLLLGFGHITGVVW